MKIYCFDKDGFFLGDMDAQPDPKKKGYLLPNNATAEIPPVCQDGQRAKWDGEKWDAAEIEKPEITEGFGCVWDGRGWIKQPVERPEVAAGYRIEWVNDQWVSVAIPEEELAELAAQSEIDAMIEETTRKIAIEQLKKESLLPMEFIDPKIIAVKP